MPDYTRYLPPGVYVDAGATPNIAPVGVAPSSICLIGAGAGYHTYTESVDFTSGNAKVLMKKGIDLNSVVVTGLIVDPAVTGSSIPYTFEKDIPGSPGTPKDYSLTADVSGGAANSVTTLNRTTTGKIDVTNFPVVQVSYNYTDSDYYALHNYEDYSTLAAAYGPALNPTSGAIVSPISLAAQFAFANGATRIYTIALSGTGTVQQQFSDAYALLSGSNTDVDIVVPLWNAVTDGTVLGTMLQTLRAALIADAGNAVLRMAVVGLDDAYAGSVSQLQTLLATAPSNRIIIPWPNKFTFYNGYTNATVALDGFYMAAALAGQLSARSQQQPLTRKLPQGFAGIPVDVQRALTKTVMDNLAKSGVCIVVPNRQNQLQVRHGLTTNYAGGVLEREISLVRSRDALYSLIQQTLDAAALIGQPITVDTALQVKSIVAGALETAKTTGLITDYLGLAVRQQVLAGGDPTVIEVKFNYKPSWPLNYVEVGFTVDTATGDNTLTAAGSPIVTP